MPTRLLTLAALLVFAARTPGANAPGPAKPADRPIPARDAAKAMTVPAGFKVTLFAGEPDVVQPIAFTFDTRGRMWVVECLSYPNWSKDGTKGNDRVVILEDTDGDGRFDKKTVFLDNGVNLSGIEFGFGGVWLCSSPNLVFVPILDGDRPGKAEVVLDGWNVKDTKHNVFNSLGWGPDGWLYGCNGIQAKARVGKPGTPDKARVPMDCGVWRYHPTRKAFEVVASGTTNPWGLDWDDYGQMFITNCVIDHMFHFVPGGHYERMYGEDLNPHVYGLMKSCCDHLHWGGGPWTSSRSTGVGGDPKHSEAGGGHAHSGCAVYLGDNFPTEYRNNVFMCNIHGNRLNRDRLVRTPGGYVAKHNPDFLFANDAWFRGICVKCGPDGGLYVSDWTDTGECHNYDKADITNGRIYRVVYGTPKSFKGDIAKLSDAELVKLQLSKNEWQVRQARRVLQERSVRHEGRTGAAVATALREILKEKIDPMQKLRVAWALNAVGGASEADLIALLGDKDENLRVWGVWLAAEHAPGPAVLAKLAGMAASDPAPIVVLAIAGAAPRLGTDGAKVVGGLLRRTDITAKNPNLALMVWYATQRALQPYVESDRGSPLPRSSVPNVRRNTARYFISSATSPDDRSRRLTGVIDQIGREVKAEQVDQLLAGIQDALAGVREFPEPKGWKELYPKLVTCPSGDVRSRAEPLAVLFGNERAIADLKARIADPSAPAATRAAAVELLTRRRVAGLVSVLYAALADPAIRGAAVRALAAYPDAGTPEKILAAYPKFTSAEKADAVQTLASRVPWANALLAAVQKGTIPRADVSVAAARQVLALNDKALSTRLGTVWGKITPASRERVTLIRKWKGVLTSDTLKSADAANGRVLFVKNCAACHRMFGEGGDTAPDLTGSQRANLDYVLENVLDPSAVVPREYQVTNFNLADGRLVSGIILKETPDGLTVRTTNETVVVPRGDIETRKPTSQSLMPEGLLDKLTPKEVRDLVGYLRSPQQVPLPAKP